MRANDVLTPEQQRYAEQFNELYLQLYGPNAGWSRDWEQNAPRVHSLLKERGLSNPFEEKEQDDGPQVEEERLSSSEPDVETPRTGGEPRVEQCPQGDGYLWYPYIKRGTWTIVQGREESGKSTTLRDIAARGSRGRAMPPDDDLSVSEPWGTLWLTAEESPEDRVLPGIAAMGGDTDRIVFPDTRLELPRDIGEVEAMVKAEGIRLVVVDTYEDFVLPTRSFSDVNRREGFAIRDIIESAEDHGYAMVPLRQLKKGRADDTKDKGMGARVIGGKSHSTLLLGHPAQDADSTLRVLASVKNRGVAQSMAPSLSYRFRPSSLDPRFAEVLWDSEESDYTAEDLSMPSYLFPNGSRPVVSVRPDVECIKAFLADGPQVEDQCLDHLNTNGFPYKKGAGNTHRFMKKAKVDSRKREFGGKTYWHRQDLGLSTGYLSN